MFVQAFAKINLYLDVIKKLDGGYHDLKMVTLPLELHDTIFIEPLPGSSDNYITCDHIELSETKYNLINLTLDKLEEKYKINKKFTIYIHKEIPICAGLGGGSSNAAAALNFINKYEKLNLNKNELINMGVEIGCDVPFCLFNKPSIVEGKGEKLTTIKLKNNFFVILIKPKKGLSTKTVFEKSDEKELPHGNYESVVKALENDDEKLLEESLFNSLECVSCELVPEINNIKTMFKNDGLKLCLMSGTGSAVFALSHNRKLMNKLYRKYEKAGFDVYLTKTL